MMPRRSARGRRVANAVMTGTSTAAALFGIAALAWIIAAVVQRGAKAINWGFFTKLPTPPGVAGGGLSNALMGTLWITLIAAAIGIPLGLLAGVYLSEFGRHSRLGRWVRFMSNVLMGVPSIIVGLFVYTIVVLPAGHFSGWAGSISLAIIMLPVVARTSEDMFRMVPDPLRESALALGAPRWKTTLSIVFRSAKAGLITGIVLAVARVSGETAPLLFTSLNSPYSVESLNEPTANLTVTIFNYAMSPYDDWQTLAWGASLIIMAAVLLLTVLSRLMLKEKASWS